jgi:predicted acetyltransferase
MIRLVQEDEFDIYADLMQKAFTVQYSEKQMADLRTRFCPGQVWGYFLDGILAAASTILPLQVYVEEKVFTMGGIAFVANYPEYRRQGMIGTLLTHCLQVMKDNGQTISLLNPFLFSFYRKYGWEYFSEHIVYHLKVSDLPKFPDTKGVVRRKKAGELQEAAEIYDSFAKRYNGMVVRSVSWWQKHVLKKTPGDIVVYYNEANIPRGYLLYTFREDKMMCIHDLVGLDEDAQRGLWKFICNHDSTIREGVMFRAPIDDRFVFKLNNPLVNRKIETSFMVRIVDVLAFMQQYPWNKGQVGNQYILHVTDQYAPWNCGTFELSGDEYGRITVTAKVDGKAEEGLQCDIQTLSTMLIGCQRPSQLYNVGKLTGKQSEVDRWESLVTAKNTYMMDLF